MGLPAMKKILTSSMMCLTAAFLSSCNDKLKIAAPYKDITVVYGLLDMGDTAHYIRIQKAFMDENKSAVDMAKIADSSFYSALTVRVKEIGPAGNVLNIIPLTRVDLAKEGYPKDTGAFFNAPNYAYKFLYTLNPANQYRVVIKNDATGDIDSAVTPIIDNSDPSRLGVVEWRANSPIGFARVYQANGKFSESTYGINIPDNVGMAQVILRFNWTDTNISTRAATHRSADYSQFYQIGSDQTLTKLTQFNTLNKDIYDFLRDAVGGAPGAFQYRYFDSCDMFVYVAGTEYKRYNDLNANKGGLTADEIRPMYTNIKGTDVLGLFSTRTYARKLQIPIAGETKDSVLQNIITKDLNIRFY